MVNLNFGSVRSGSVGSEFRCERVDPTIQLVISNWRFLVNFVGVILPNCFISDHPQPIRRVRDMLGLNGELLQVPKQLGGRLSDFSVFMGCFFKYLRCANLRLRFILKFFSQKSVWKLFLLCVCIFNCVRFREVTIGERTTIKCSPSEVTGERRRRIVGGVEGSMFR